MTSCGYIKLEGKTTAEWKQSTFSNAYKNTGTSRVSMDEYWIKPQAPYYKDIAESFQHCVKDYIGVFDKIATTHHSDFRINRYKQGGFMKQHIDAIHHSHGQKQGFPHLTSLIFLNDDYEGGEFVLCGDKYIEKIQGSAVVFPSNFMYPHEVKEVTEGKLFSIMTWIL